VQLSRVRPQQAYATELMRPCLLAGRLLWQRHLDTADAGARKVSARLVSVL